MEYVEAHEEEYSPFMSFGESEEEEDKDFAAYVERLKSDGEWAGQVELIAAAHALRVHIVVHQMEHPSYRIECQGGSSGGSSAPRQIHLSYHDGEHYNSVRPLGGISQPSARGGGGSRQGGSSHDKGGAEEENDELSRLAYDTAAVDLSAGPGEGGAEGDGAHATGAAAEVAGKSDDDEGDAKPALSAKAAKQKEKARKKEEKARKKEQKHREAVAAAGGGVSDGDDETPGDSQSTAGGRSMITL